MALPLLVACSLICSASGSLSSNEKKSCNMNTNETHCQCHGWQSHDCTARLEPEPGIECGVSAPFALRRGAKLIMAGGCNFPVDPLGAGSKKRFYSGIYAADTANLDGGWQRIGTLPHPTAYGATALTPAGAVLIGGTPEGTPTNEAVMMTLDAEGAIGWDVLPELPATADNMAAAAIGNRVFVAGGNIGGVPSNDLFCLNLDSRAEGWKRLAPMPGNPRVQPVMAAAEGPDGEMCLYLWGGFAGRHGSHEPTLELDGLVYTPSKDEWRFVAGPVDADGQPVATGGGAACTLSDGRIAIAGGVNKDVFLEALRNQAPDYLLHPVEWYRFNPNILMFNPRSESWETVSMVTADAARAGAAIVAGPSSDFYLMGGELKPRIRTAATLHVK